MEKSELEAFLSFLVENQGLIESNLWNQVYDKLILQEQRLIDTGVVTDYGFVGAFTKEILDCGINPLEYMSKVPNYFMQFVQDIKEPPTIPENITSIGRFAFAYCDNLEKAYISRTIKTVEPYAFYGCTKLKNIYFDGRILELNNIQFGPYWCKGPTNVTLHCSDGDMIGVLQPERGKDLQWKAVQK